MIFDVISWLRDGLCGVIFFNRLSGPVRSGGCRVIGLILFYMLQMPIYLLSDQISSMVVRYLIRLAASCVYLWIFKGLRHYHWLYFALLFTNTVVAVQTMLPLKTFVLPENSGRWADEVIISIVQFVCPIIIAWSIPFTRIKRLHPLQIGFSVLLAVLILYTKNVMRQFLYGGFSIPTEMRLYPILLVLFLLMLLANMDRFFVLNEERRQQTMIELSRDYQYRNLQARLDAQQDVSRLYHDMKNHLLALAASGSSFQQQYINGMLEQISDYQQLVETGNEVLNGLLQQKMRFAHSKKISVVHSLDITQLSYLEPVDICTIFGNALDNAIEAAEKLPVESERFINLKSRVFANQMVISISNSCLANLTLQEDMLPQTTKADKVLHGIGMESIRRTLICYRGTMTYKMHDKGLFTLKIMLPLELPQGMDNSIAL